MSAVEIILGRLDDVQRSGNGWRAKCPSCGGRGGKVSIAEGDDGRALLHCFGGCDAVAVTQAAGLTLADLFPEPLKDDSPESRRRMRRAARESQWGAALDVLDLEAHVIFIHACDMATGKALSGGDVARLATAIRRVSDARGVLRDTPRWRPTGMVTR